MLFKRSKNELKCELESQHVKDLDNTQVEKQLQIQLCNLERFINILYKKVYIKNLLNFHREMVELRKFKDNFNTMKDQNKNFLSTVTNGLKSFFHWTYSRKVVNQNDESHKQQYVRFVIKAMSLFNLCFSIQKDDENCIQFHKNSEMIDSLKDRVSDLKNSNSKYRK